MAGWTQERSDEVKKAFLEFLDNVWVNSKESGWIVLGPNLYGAQKIVIERVFDGLAHDKHDFKILKSRQLGVSTIVRALMLFWSGVFECTGALVFHETAALHDAHIELTNMLERMDPSFRFPRIKANNRNSLVLRNRSRIIMMSAGVKETKGSNALGASTAISLAHRSELCSYGNRAGIESMRHSMARDNPNRLFIDESTARGPNLWYDIWNAAKDDEDCVCIFAGWWSHPGQIIRRDHANFKKYTQKPLSDDEKRKILLVKEQYGHEITIEQLAWIRKEMDLDAIEQAAEGLDWSVDPLRLQEQPWCIAAKERVGTWRGIIPISEVVIGDVCSQGHIINAGPTGQAKIWEARTNLGYSLRGTANHPLINVDGNEVELAKSYGQSVKLQPPVFATRPHVVKWKEGVVECAVEITEELARWTGLFMGDGSAYKSGQYNHTVRITCCNEDPDLIEEVKRLFGSVFDVHAHLHKNSEGATDVGASTRHTLHTIRMLGLLRDDSVRTIRKVHVPDFIWRSPREVVKEFLAGLFEADGFQDKSLYRCVLFAKDAEFLYDIQLLLLGFGITCRVRPMNQRKGTRVFPGCELSLRKAEAILFNEQIGFLSKRKRERYSDKKNGDLPGLGHRPILTLEDEIEEVRETDRTETVYNVTVEDTHLFDANGILTHNTEDDAFQISGSVFFDPGKLTDQLHKNANDKYETYAAHAGLDFADFQMMPAANRRSVQLKVWEPPVEDSVYIIAADPAYGINEKNDRSAVQVLRAYSDGLDQVAEYAWPLIDAQQLAWVIAALEAWYAGEKSEVWRIIEINGPGEATFRELRSLKQKLQFQYFGNVMKESGLGNVQRNVRDYFYHRTDSVRPGLSMQWKTTLQLKIAILERCRDFTHNGILRIRSRDTLEEMRCMTREGDTIKAEGNEHDDRVLALAMACRQWEEGPRRQLMARRRTREAEAARRRMTVKDMVTAFNEAQLTRFIAGRNASRQALINAQLSRKWGRR